MSDSPNSTARHGDGFSLLEVMVAIAIMAIVLTLAYQTNSGIQRAAARVIDGGSRARAAQVVLDRIEREIVGTLMVQRQDGDDPLLHPYVFFADDRVSGDGDADELIFITQTPLRSIGSGTGGVRSVSYGARPSDALGHLELLRAEKPLPRQMERDIDLSDAQVVAEDVADFDLRYRGEDVDWVDRWDSTGVVQLDLIPEAVEISLALWERDRSGAATKGERVTRTVLLPVRPFPMAPPAEGVDGECATGISLAECVARFQRQLAEVPTLQAEIQRQLGLVPESCWNVPDPSDALTVLQNTLRIGLGIDLAEACPDEPAIDEPGSDAP